MTAFVAAPTPNPTLEEHLECMLEAFSDPRLIAAYEQRFGWGIERAMLALRAFEQGKRLWTVRLVTGEMADDALPPSPGSVAWGRPLAFAGLLTVLRAAGLKVDTVVCRPGGGVAVKYRGEPVAFCEPAPMQWSSQDRQSRAYAVVRGLYTNEMARLAERLTKLPAFAHAVDGCRIIFRNTPGADSFIAVNPLDVMAAVVELARAHGHQVARPFANNAMRRAMAWKDKDAFSKPWRAHHPSDPYQLVDVTSGESVIAGDFATALALLERDLAKADPLLRRQMALRVTPNRRGGGVELELFGPDKPLVEEPGRVSRRRRVPHLQRIDEQSVQLHRYAAPCEYVRAENVQMLEEFESYGMSAPALLAQLLGARLAEEATHVGARGSVSIVNLVDAPGNGLPGSHQALAASAA